MTGNTRLPLVLVAWALGFLAEATDAPFDRRLRALWDERHDQEPWLFRFKMDGVVEVRTVGRFLAQKCPGRASKRPLGQDTQRVVSALDLNKFHFGKARAREFISALDDGKDGLRQLVLPESVMDDLPPNATAVLVNVSPILRYHFVLAPFLSSLRAQVLTRESLQVAGAVLSFGGETLRLLYNSLGGAASVNHLHFQGYYLGVDGFPTSLPLETEDVSWHTPQVGEVLSWPLHAVVLLANAAEGLAAAVHQIVDRLLRNNIAHHLLLARRGNDYVAYVVARRLQQRFDSRFINVAVNEAVGWFICPDAAEFESLAENGATSMLARWRLPEDEWRRADALGAAILPSSSADSGDEL